MIGDWQGERNFLKNTSCVPKDDPSVLLTWCTEELRMRRIPWDIIDIVRMPSWEKGGSSWLHLQTRVFECIYGHLENQAYTFFGRPDSGRLIDSDGCEFFSITIPCNMGHRLSAGYSVVARLESRKSGWLYIKVGDEALWVMKKVSYMDTSSCESCVDGWGRWTLWRQNLVLWCWHSL